ncbi:unnamed protein product [Amoebophrya sp. A25]|nr:unnamed protein product [Amoebophrya sp. A25]|eukprot:GSA25T00018431001.1
MAKTRVRVPDGPPNAPRTEAGATKTKPVTMTKEEQKVLAKQVTGTVTPRLALEETQTSRMAGEGNGPAESFLEDALGDGSMTGTSTPTTSESGAIDVSTSLVLGSASTVIVVLGLYLCRRQLRSCFCPKRALPLLPPTSDDKAQSYGSLSAMENV